MRRISPLFFLGLFCLPLLDAQQHPYWEAEKHMLQAHHVQQQRTWEEAAMRAAKDVENPFLPPSSKQRAFSIPKDETTKERSAASEPPLPPRPSRKAPLSPAFVSEGEGGQGASKSAAAVQEGGKLQGGQASTIPFAPLQMPIDALENLHLKFDASNPVHVLLAAPSYGGMVTEGFAMSLVQASVTAQSIKGFDLSIKLLPGDSLVTRARNTLVALFLGSPQYTHLLFIDTDISFALDNILRLVERSRKTPIVAAPYPKKGLLFERLKSHITKTLAKDPQHDFTIEELQDSMIDFVFNPVSELLAADDVASDFDSSTAAKGRKRRALLQMEDGFVRVDNAGTGFLLIRRDVLEIMAEFYSDLQYHNDIPSYASPTTDPHFYGLFDTMTDPTSRRFLSEDYAFCRRAQALGYELWMDLHSDLAHFGSYTYDGNFLGNFVLEAGG